MITGSCQCGAVRIRVDGKLGPVVYCHCSQCRRANGYVGSKAEWFELPDDGLPRHEAWIVPPDPPKEPA
jgi:hypothetical protein